MYNARRDYAWKEKSVTKQNTVWIPQSTRYFYIKHTSELLLPNINNPSLPKMSKGVCFEHI